MRFYLDTEFVERGYDKIELISIGIVAENGAEYYAVASDGWKREHASEWVQKNVLPFVAAGPFRTRKEIAEDIRAFVGNDPEFWGYYCVAPETRVLTADLRWVQIGSVRVGDKLAAFDEESSRGRGRSSKWRCWRSAEVESTETIDRPCCDLLFDSGTTVRCSADHRWLTNTGHEKASWTITEKLRAGHSKVVRPVEPWETVHTRAAGYLAAAFDGEGFLTQTNLAQGGHAGTFRFRIGFAQKQNAMLDEVRRLLADARYTVAGGKRPVFTGVHNLLIGNRGDVLRFLGSVRPLRLLSTFQVEKCGAMSLRTDRLARKTAAGVRDVVSIKTTAGTYIAEGFASHNCDYDWVLLCQLFGTMMDLPKGWPMFCCDVIQLCKHKGNPKLPKQPSNEAHHALSDARHIKVMHEFLMGYPWVD